MVQNKYQSPNFVGPISIINNPNIFDTAPFDYIEACTVEPQLSEPHGRHTIWPDNRGVRIDEGSRNSRSMGYRVGDN